MHIALVESAGARLIMKGAIHEINDRYYLVVEEDTITRWYPVVYENWTWAFHGRVGSDVYGNDLFLRDIVGFIADDSSRKVGIVFEDEELGFSIREITSVANGSIEWWDGEDYYLSSDAVRRLGTTLKPDFDEIEIFLSGRSIETDRMLAAKKIEAVQD